MKKPKEPTDDNNERDPLALTRLLASLEAQLKRITATDDESIMRRTKLARLYGQLLDVNRKQEAAEMKRTSALDKARILEWFRAQPQPDQTRFVGELQTIVARKSGLA